MSAIKAGQKWQLTTTSTTLNNIQI